MKLKLSDKKSSTLAITGHVGCGHSHSHKQYIQDDSGGLAVTLNILSKATGLPLTIADVRVENGANGYFEIETASGGIARQYPKRGITPHEANLAKSAIGKDAKLTHTTTLETFGRYYGQGISEQGVSFQTAIAKAAINSFVKNFPDKFLYGEEDIKGNCGAYIGTVIDVDNIPVSIMSVVNATEGGIGPNEDLEGNCYGSTKHDIMQKLGMINSPTIIIEGKVYTPLYCDELNEETFFVRADRKEDNPIIALALEEAGGSLKYNIQYNDKVMARVENGLRNQTQELGLKIAKKAEELSLAEFANNKVKIISELAELISQDCGGISFMSNSLNEIIGGVGLVPYTAAVVSLLVTKKYRDEVIFPYLTNNDCQRFADIILNAIPLINANYDEAKRYINKGNFNKNMDDYIVRG